MMSEGVGVVVIIGIIIWVCYIWNKVDTVSCRVCGRVIKLSDKGTHKYWRWGGFYGSLMTHALCERCGWEHDKGLDS